MIDLHCHILPGTDDGARSLDEALRMCALAAADGVETIVATPHIRDTSPLTAADVARAAAELNEAAGGRPAILPGGDVAFSPQLDAMIAAGTLPTINGTRYILLEFGDSFDRGVVEQGVFRLQVKGYGIIVSHPERQSVFAERAGLLEGLVARGCLVQVTAGSITGRFGRPAADRVRRLLEAGMVHVIASDAHSDTRRRPILSEAAAAARAWIGGAADAMVDENPRRIVAGERIAP